MSFTGNSCRERKWSALYPPRVLSWKCVVKRPMTAFHDRCSSPSSKNNSTCVPTPLRPPHLFFFVTVFLVTCPAPLLQRLPWESLSCYTSTRHSRSKDRSTANVMLSEPSAAATMGTASGSSMGRRPKSPRGLRRHGFPGREQFATAGARSTSSTSIANSKSDRDDKVMMDRSEDRFGESSRKRSPGEHFVGRFGERSRGLSTEMSAVGHIENDLRFIPSKVETSKADERCSPPRSIRATGLGSGGGLNATVGGRREEGHAVTGEDAAAAAAAADVRDALEKGVEWCPRTALARACEVEPRLEEAARAFEEENPGATIM